MALSARRPRLALVLLLLAAGLRPAAAAIFHADDPIARDPDDLPSPIPLETRVDESYDLLARNFLDRPRPEAVRALDINTLGEVPDSSWFSNRIGIRPISLEELEHGPAGVGPPADGEWLVIGAKSSGRTLGFRIRDRRGEVYLVKFESPENAETASAAEVISSRILHAIGYRVPENHVAWVRREELRIATGTRIKATKSRWLDLTDNRLDRMLRQVAPDRDGRYRVMASHIVEGTALGPFQFHGLRGDDANDIFPHEHRRALRALYVFASWIDHTDSGAPNTLDTYVGEIDHGHVVHHLVDFDSTLGSSGDLPKRPWEGYEHFFESGRFLRSLLTVGLWAPRETRVEVPRLPGVGRAFDAELFEPGSWRPDYPNPAFANLDTEDAFWACRILLRFNEESLRAVVRAGQLSDRTSQEYLVRTLLARRDKICRHWLQRVVPLDGFEVLGTRLHFSDLAQHHRLQPAGGTPAGQVEQFDNASGARTALSVGSIAPAAESVALPESLLGAARGAYFVVRLTGGGHWVDVFLRRGAGGLEVAGIARERQPAFAD